MRICAISLPELRIEVVRSGISGASVVEATGPLGIVVAASPMTEAKLLGNMKLDVVSREARRYGVVPGQTIAQARARVANLEVRVVRPEAVKDVLARLAEVALAFGATVSFDVDPDIVWVDVTGCAHLHDPSSTTNGEEVLAARLANAIFSLGHACAIAIADGPRVAAMLAHAAASTFRREPPRVLVPPGKNADAIGPLDISALPLSKEDVRWLHRIGVRSVTELRNLPQSALGSRLGANRAAVLSLAHGDDRAPLNPYFAPEIPLEEVSLEYGIEGSEALTFVTKTLCDRLASRLAGRSMAAARVVLGLTLDSGMLPSGTSPLREVAIDLSAPLSSARDLLAAFRPKLERLELEAPVVGAKLSAPTLVRKREAALSLFEPLPKASLMLPRLIAELSSDLGVDAVGKLELGDAWVPEERSKLVRIEGVKSDARTKKRRHLLSSVPEPTRILADPEVVPRESVRIVRHLSRNEAVEWWKRLPGERPDRGVDFVYAWVDHRERTGAPAWVEVNRTSGEARVRGWFD